MSSNTPNLSLRKPDPTDLVDVTTDISENMDKIDTAVAAKATSAALAAHEADTTAIHGITDTAALSLNTHAHGGVYEPVATAHATRHNAGGADALAVDAAAATASLRTLGTGATQAAVGSHAHAGTAVSFTPTGSIAATDVSGALAELDSEKSATGHTHATPVVIAVAVSDETTAITTGTAKLTFRMPHAMTLTAVRASLTTASTSGIPTVDINEVGTTILSTKLTVDANEKTSTTAAAAAVISDSALADDAEITFDIDVAGTGATGLKVYLIGTRS